MSDIAVLTVSRSDYGILRPVLRRISAAPELRLRLIAAGSHLSIEHGATLGNVREDGFEPAAICPTLPEADTPLAAAQAQGRAVEAFAAVLHKLSPRILVLTGDRYDMHAAALAALPLRIPVAHIHGGELTLGAIDDALRHSMTKLSHLHFASTQNHAQRIIRMGEAPWRVQVTGAPALDNLKEIALLELTALAKALNIPSSPAPLLLTFHPETLSDCAPERQIEEVLAGLEDCERPIVVTAPNHDPGGDAVRDRLKRFAEGRRDAVFIENLGTQRYFSLLRSAAAMVGNSSSGIVEAPSFELPVLNVGGRQRGRLRARNVIESECERSAVRAGLNRALSREFRESLRGLANPYGDGGAAERIVARLLDLPGNEELLNKVFYDEEAPA